MTREEVKQVYFKVCDLYPNFKPHNPQATLDEWVNHLSRYDRPEIEDTLSRYIDNNPGGYAPNISNLIPQKDAAQFSGRHYTHADYEQMEQAATAWLYE